MAPASTYPIRRKRLARLQLSLSCLLVAGVSAYTPATAAPAPEDQVPRAAHSLRLTLHTDGMDVRVKGGVMRLTALTDAIVRVRIARDGAFPEDASWAALPAMRAKSVVVTPLQDGFATKSLRVRFAGDRLIIEDLAGKPILADAAAPIALDGTAYALRKEMPQAEHYFALGDKTGGLDRRGKSFVNWNTDAFGFTDSTDPIYKSIPFFVGVGGEGGSYGLFMDNSWRSWFDFGHKEENILSFGASDGPIDYYVIHGPTTADVVRRYTDLTGKPALPPRWALGYQQSRYSYMSGEELRTIADRLRSDRIPTDVLWLDIDFQDRNRPFTINSQTFPRFKELVGDLGKDGFKVVTITDLHIAEAPGESYAPYDSGMGEDRFVRRADGSVYVAPVWPGPSLFPDFTQADTRAWWGKLFAPQVADGVAGSWNDMNEPAIFNTPTKTMPEDVRHRISGSGFADRIASHAEIHNVYGMENSRATYEGLRALAPDKRAFVMTRASYAGGQRYAVTWTGDNRATWDHLKLSVHQIINLGLSGFAYSGADVSGFTGGPSPELLTRWFEIGAFYPIFRDHSAKDTPRVEPWVDGPEHLAIRRRFVEERYKLLPYFYALADQNARSGDPLLRPVFYDYPTALNMSCDQSFAFTLGRSLLVAPPPSPESPQDYDVCLPAGGWFDYWTGLPAGKRQEALSGQIQSATQATGVRVEASDIVRETPRLDHLPVFVRSGTILPRQPIVQNTSQVPQGALQLDVYPGDDCRGELYADDGESMAYERGAYLRQTLRCQSHNGDLRLELGEREGSYKPWWRDIHVTIHGWQNESRIVLGRKSLKGRTDAALQTLTFSMPDNGRSAQVLIGPAR